MANDAQGGFDDFGRSFSERRVAARKSLERCSFEGPRSKDHDDGYAPSSNNSLLRQSGKELHASGDSSGNLAELAEQPQQPRETMLRRPPSMDRKPRRSESELPDSAVVAAARKAAAANGGVPTAVVGNNDVEGYKSTGYFGNKADTGYTMMGKAPCDAHLRG